MVESSATARSSKVGRHPAPKPWTNPRAIVSGCNALQDQRDSQIQAFAEGAIIIACRPSLQRVDNHPCHDLSNVRRHNVGSDLSLLLTVADNPAEHVVKEDLIAAELA